MAVLNRFCGGLKPHVLLWPLAMLLVSACSSDSGGVTGGNGQGNDPNNLAATISGFTGSTSIFADQTDPVSITVNFSDGVDGADTATVSVVWSQISGPVVSLLNRESATVSFAAPSNSQLAGQSSATIELSVRLTDDDGAITTGTLSITVNPPLSSQLPTANAGEDIVVDSGHPNVSILGSGTDPDGTVTNQPEWTVLPQAGVPTLSVSQESSNLFIAKFTAPTVDVVTTYQLQLKVFDNGGNSDTDVVNVTVSPLPSAAGQHNLFVSDANGEVSKISNDGTKAYSDSDFDNSFAFSGGLNAGIVFDANRSLFSTNGTGQIAHDCAVPLRPTGSNSEQGRSFQDEQTTTSNPEEFDSFTSIAIDHTGGHLIVLDTNSSDNRDNPGIKVFYTNSSDDSLALDDTSFGEQAPTDIAYDSFADRLFIAFPETVAVIDGFLGQAVAGTPVIADRVIRPLDANNNGPTSISAIAYDSIGDRLLIADEGVLVVDPADINTSDANSDGKVFLIIEAASAFGNVRAQKVIAGSLTQLGNPTDILINGRDLIVADASASAVLQFKDGITLFAAGGNVSPFGGVNLADAPVALAVEVAGSSRPARADVTDFAENSSDAIGILMSRADSSGNVDVLRYDLGLTGVASVFDGPAGGAAKLAVDLSGDVYITRQTEGSMTSNTATEAALTSLHRAALGRTNGVFSSNRDRTDSGLFGRPAGMDLVSDMGLALIADQGASNSLLLPPGTNYSNGISVVSLCSGAELARVDVDQTITDLDYDPSTGDLYASLLADGGLPAAIGVFRGFDNFLNTVVAGAPSGGGISVKLELVEQNALGGSDAVLGEPMSVEYVPGADRLIVADANKTTSTEGAALFVVNNASTIFVSQVVVNKEFLGSNTLLQAPSDIVFDGNNLYVADPGAGRVLRFDDILTVSGGNIAPAASTAEADVSGLALLPGYIPGSPLDSIVP